MKFTQVCMIVLFIVFLLFLMKAHWDDYEMIKQFERDNKQPCLICKLHHSAEDNFHTAVIKTMKYENEMGIFVDSKVKKLLMATRDHVIRGIIMGAIEGNPVVALHSAMLFTFSGGVISGISDWCGWHTKLHPPGDVPVTTLKTGRVCNPLKLLDF